MNQNGGEVIRDSLEQVPLKLRAVSHSLCGLQFGSFQWTLPLLAPRFRVVPVGLEASQAPAKSGPSPAGRHAEEPIR